MTDHEGKVAWSAQYRAWGQANVAISEAAYKAGIRNPIRFQGQYFDDETGLHYNRHRYFDPLSGRFVSKDPIGLLGGINTQSYPHNPIQWADPLGLSSKRPKTTGAGTKCPKCNPCAGKNPAALARSWQGATKAPYVGVDSYTNTVLKKGTVLFTLYPYGPSPGNYFAGSPTVSKGGSAQGYNDAVQVAHAGNTRNARPMRTQVQTFIVKEDICIAKGTALANPHLGTGGGTQYFIEDGDKPKLTGGPILKFSK